MSTNNDPTWDELSRQIAEAAAAASARLELPRNLEGALDANTLQMIEDVNAVVGATKRLTAELGRSPTHAEIAQATGLSTDYIARCTKTAPEPWTSLGK